MALTFILNDEYDEVARRVLERVAASGACVPALWEFEIANSLRSAERRGRIAEAGISHALSAFAQLPITRNTSPLDSQRVISLAREFDLSVYDAAYLELAIRLNAPLATRDGALAGAARRAGVNVLA